MANVSKEQKLLTRQSIQNAATQLFAEQGYSGTTVREIALAAQVSESSIFTYFGSKDDLLVSILIPQTSAIARFVLMTTPGETVANLMRNHFAEVFPVGKPLLREFIAVLQRTPIGGRSPLQEVTHAFDQRLIGALQHMVEHFDIEEPQIALGIIVGIITSNFQLYTLDEKMSVPEYLAQIAAQVDYAVKGRQPVSSRNKDATARVVTI